MEYCLASLPPRYAEKLLVALILNPKDRIQQIWKSNIHVRIFFELELTITVFPKLCECLFGEHVVTGAINHLDHRWKTQIGSSPADRTYRTVRWPCKIRQMS